MCIVCLVHTVCNYHNFVFKLVPISKPTLKVRNVFLMKEGIAF